MRFLIGLLFAATGAVVMAETQVPNMPGTIVIRESRTNPNDISILQVSQKLSKGHKLSTQEKSGFKAVGPEANLDHVSLIANDADKELASSNGNGAQVWNVGYYGYRGGYVRGYYGYRGGYGGYYRPYYPRYYPRYVYGGYSYGYRPYYSYTTPYYDYYYCGNCGYYSCDGW